MGRVGQPGIQPDAVAHRGIQESRYAALAMPQDAAGDNPGDIKLLERSTGAGGHPSLAADGPTGKSPLWQIRAPKDLDVALRARADAVGHSLSEVLRDAASEYLAAHAS